MTNKYLYFVANWKMYGDLTTLNSLDKVIKFLKTIRQKRFKLIYCPPNTLIRPLSKRLKKTKIEVGAQNCHENEDYGAFTGSLNSKMFEKKINLISITGTLNSNETRYLCMRYQVPFVIKTIFMK